MQPAVQHFAKVFESFTKPNPDPSEAIGFWDKMRIMMHARILMELNVRRKYSIMVKVLVIHILLLDVVLVLYYVETRMLKYD